MRWNAGGRSARNQPLGQQRVRSSHGLAHLALAPAFEPLPFGCRAASDAPAFADGGELGEPVLWVAVEHRVQCVAYGGLWPVLDRHVVSESRPSVTDRPDGAIRGSADRRQQMIGGQAPLVAHTHTICALDPTPVANLVSRLPRVHARMNRRFQDESVVPISIKDPDTDSKIRDLAALTGESITVAVRTAIEQRLRRESSRRRAGVAQRLLALSLARPGLEKRNQETAEEAIGYDDHGLPG